MQPFLSSPLKSAQGLVDLSLRASYTLKEEDDLPFFENLLTTFSTDIGIEIETVTEMLSRIDVDFKALYESCIKLKGMTGCIGVLRVHKAYQNLGEASVNKHKDGCLVALDLIKSEYDTVKSQLKILLEMERDVNRRKYRGKTFAFH